MTTTLATPVIAPEAAAARLRLRGFLVRPHGIKWLVLQDGHPRRLTLSPGDLSLAAQIAQAADDRLSMDQLAEQLYAETGETPPSAGVSTDPPGGWGYQSLLIRQIRRDGGTQARIGLSEDTVQEYAELMREHRWDFQTMQRPIVLYDGDAFWLADGFHRIEAAQRAQMTDYPVEVLRGTKRDAILRACGANSQHGLRRTNTDKRRAVELLLRDDEWRQWSDRKIANTCAVSDKTVAAVRRDLSAEFPQIETRTVERNGSTYQMTPATPKPSGAINRPDGSPSNGVVPPAAPDLTPFGFTARVLPDGRIAIRSEGNLETEHTHQQLNDLIAHWRGYGAIPADLADKGVVWRYRQDKMYQVLCGDSIGQTGYTAAECLAHQRESMQRAGLIGAPAAAESTPRIPLGTPSELPIPTDTDAALDDAALAASIRELAEPLGLQMIWEDGKVQLYWPHEIDDIEQMDLLSYGAALEWLTWEAKGIKLDMDERAEQPDPAHVERLEEQIEADRIPEAGMQIASASDRQSHIAQEQADQRIIITAENAIQIGDSERARQLLSQVSEVSAWKRDQLLAMIPATQRASGRQITLGLTSDECAALLKEARIFANSNLTKTLPTIGQALILMVEAIKGVQ